MAISFADFSFAKQVWSELTVGPAICQEIVETRYGLRAGPERTSPRVWVRVSKAQVPGWV